jgi:hypothetical protein
MNKLSNLMWIAILLTAIVVNGCDQKSKTSMKEPVAKKIEKVFEEHGQQRIDNYYWLNQREDPEVIAYLNDENNYTKEALKDTEEL